MFVVLALLLTACAQPATPQVVEVEKEVVVEKQVVETIVVEKEVAVEKVVVKTVIVEKEVEKKVVETVIVEKEKIKEVVVTPTPPPVPLHKPGEPVRMILGVTHGPHINPVVGYLKWADRLVLHPILPALIWFNDSSEVIPSLAEEFQISADATAITFTLPRRN